MYSLQSIIPESEESSLQYHLLLKKKKKNYFKCEFEIIHVVIHVGREL